MSPGAYGPPGLDHPISRAAVERCSAVCCRAEWLSERDFNIIIRRQWELPTVTDATRYRDSTEIVLPDGTLGDLREELERDFVCTVMDEGDTVRIIGSPVVIKDVSKFLSRHGVSLP